MDISPLLQDLVVIDFESKPIEEHKPPPDPVGVAIYWPDGRKEYLAWGHRNGNNITKEGASDRLRSIVERDATLLFHNGKFDLSLLYNLLQMGVDIPWQRLHDTQFLLVLLEPYAKSLALKDAGVRLLKRAATERDEVIAWLMANEFDAVQTRYRCLKAQGHSKITMEKAAKGLIWLAPVPLVAKYAIQDTALTRELFEYIYPKILAGGMENAYNLERRFMGPLTRLELKGLSIDKEGLERTLVELKAGMQEAALRIYDKLNEFVDIGSPSLARVLSRKGVVKGLLKTPTGRDSTSKDSLSAAEFVDPELRELIMYWRGCAYVINNSIEPWLESAGKGDVIYTTWHQTRGTDPSGDAGGARTLRLSAAWLLNISKRRKLKYNLLPGLPQIPSPREFLIPHPGFKYIVCRDWSQQEFRLAAHFENGSLMRAYQKTPRMDVHTDNTANIARMNYIFHRDIIKVYDLAIIYGMGKKKALVQANKALKAKNPLAPPLTEAEGELIYDLVRRSVPDLIQLAKRVQTKEKQTGFIRTFMGAKLTKEPPLLWQGKMIDFGYKLLNHLCQRSAAEQMKMAIVNWHELGYQDQWPWYVSIHDENNVCANEDWIDCSQALDKVMRMGAYDVPMVSDLAMGPNFGELEDLVELQEEDFLRAA